MEELGVIVRDIDSPPPPIRGGQVQQQMNKDTVELNSTINQLDNQYP